MSLACPRSRRRPAVVTVASVPASHPYVRHLSHTTRTDDVVRLPDPIPADGQKIAGAWWPPVMLDPAWIDAHADEFDLLHLHFGFDALSTDTLAEVVDALRRHDKPLVFTVHDLHNPHQVDVTAHDRQLDVLIPAAARLITLTPGAAAQIERRWGRRAEVIPHPHIVPLTDLPSSRDRTPTTTVGLHLKSLRANMGAPAALDALSTVARRSPAVRVVVDVHHDVLDPSSRNHSPAVVETLARLVSEGAIETHVHDFYTDAELFAYLRSLDVSVLAYRFGTHSGWLEACADLGTTVVAADCGFYEQQHPCETFQVTSDGIDVDSLVEAIDAACASERVPLGPQIRSAERDDIADRHALIYRDVLR